MPYDLFAMTHHRTRSGTTRGRPSWLRIVILLLIYGGLLAGGHWGSEWLIGLVGVDLGPGVESHARHLVMAGVIHFERLKID